MTILQVFHKMGVSGVGSYLLNLCAELVRRGHRVLLAGPEGELTPSFRHIGVDCRAVAINEWRLLRARRDLARLIDAEDVDVVHAHDYSAGAAAFLASRKATVPYLLTIHFRRPAWQRFLVFYWSERVLTVSDSLRASLIHELRLAPDRVILTRGGVDTTRFTPGPVPPSLSAELAVSPANTVVLHVSRLAWSKSPVALALIAAAPLLASTVPDLLVVIVGTGRDEARARAAADRVNASVGRTLVRVLGLRADIPDLMRLAAVVVGTGTVALEALASGCPVVAAGTFGYVGRVTPESFAAARADCFGDHEAPAQLSVATMAEDLLPLLLDSVYRHRLSVWGRQVAVEQFAVPSMADDVERIYASVLARMPHRRSVAVSPHPGPPDVHP